jgi:hypothetical protein
LPVACAQHGFSFESDAFENGAFTEALLEALGGKADGDGTITDELRMITCRGGLDRELAASAGLESAPGLLDAHKPAVDLTLVDGGDGCFRVGVGRHLDVREPARVAVSLARRHRDRQDLAPALAECGV